MQTLYTIGYGAWPADARAARLVAALRTAGVRTLVDIRHSPCASNLDPKNPYGPREWHLQSGDRGIVPLLRGYGIRYRWLVELGNPQKTDPGMQVLRSHLQSGSSEFPVNRGIDVLATMIIADPAGPYGLLCACARFDECHRSVIAHALRERWGAGDLEVADLNS